MLVEEEILSGYILAVICLLPHNGYGFGSALGKIWVILWYNIQCFVFNHRVINLEIM